MNDDIRKSYLDKISLYAYNDYLEAIENNQIIFESCIDNNGFLYVKDNGNGYGIRISYNTNGPKDVGKEIINMITPYLEEPKGECYILINSTHKDLIDYFHSIGFKLLYPSFNMVLLRENVKQFDDTVEILPYEKKYENAFLELLGEAFVPIRTKLNLEPYNWHQNNQEEAVKGFQESASKGHLFGYFLEDELIGVLEVVGNELETIAVKQNHQGKGLGAKLLAKAINMVFANPEYHEMTLGALQGNDQAEEFYKKFNFTIVSTQTVLKRKSN